MVGALKTPGEADFGSVIEHGVARTKVGKVWARHREALVTDIEVESRLNGVSETGGELPSKVPLVRRVSADFGQSSPGLVDHPVCTDSSPDIATERALREVVVGCVEEDRDLIEGSCAIAGVIFPDNGVNRVVDEVSFHRETKLREDIIASLEIVTDSGIKNGFAVDGLIAKTGAPRLK